LLSYLSISANGQDLDRQVISGYTSVFSAPVGGVNMSAYRVDNFTSSDLMVISGFEQPDSHVLIGISEIDLMKLRLYPNPGVDKVQLLANSDEQIELQLVNGMGQVVKVEWFTQSAELDISRLKPGPYYVVCTSSNGSRSTQTLIKQN
jgi:hypothetical protein